MVVAYLALIANRARIPTCRSTIPSKPFIEVPDFYETARTGMHYLLPVIGADLVPDGRGDVARASPRSGASSRWPAWC